MSNFENPNGKKYDLEDRTEHFAISLIHFIKNIKTTIYNENIIRQLLKSSTSIGANYREANGAEPKRDFKHKIAICKKEAKETQYWLRLLFGTNPDTKEAGGVILKEAHELILIFAKIYSSSK
ncbi:four helix bundle protein [Patescibacteria group bacterium]|nr:four helix bundle protein [Patescibacteria group bacterium]